ncbi:actinodin3 [Chanos chanos]|uniref:Actinodin3 n=1 Tax=Chanos chanos TaxID=29144 RepID=A0A6J2WXD7_CHACN|nr:extensin-like [Chanos chanos]
MFIKALTREERLERHKVSVDGVSIDSSKANDFLAHSRPKRQTGPKWYHKNPDFQSYYRFYNSIGHIEGLYEIDKIRMLYQQMRHLEQEYGPDASSFQSRLGLPAATTTSPTTPKPTTPPPPPPTTPTPLARALSQGDVMYLCNPKDPLCKPHIVYLPTGGIPIVCDPRYHSDCKLPTLPEAPAEPEAPSPSASKESPPSNPITFKGMEYDCDPYWDPDCLIDHPPRPMKESVKPPSLPTTLPVSEKKNKETEVDPDPYDPYDFNRDLFDPYRYSYPAPEPQ